MSLPSITIHSCYNITKSYYITVLLTGHTRVDHSVYYLNMDFIHSADFQSGRTIAGTLQGKLVCMVTLAIANSSLTANSQNFKTLILCLFTLGRCLAVGRQAGDGEDEPGLCPWDKLLSLAAKAPHIWVEQAPAAGRSCQLTHMLFQKKMCDCWHS